MGKELPVLLVGAELNRFDCVRCVTLLAHSVPISKPVLHSELFPQANHCHVTAVCAGQHDGAE